MSALIFPSGLLGIGIGVKRTPFYETLIQTSPSRKDLRVQFDAFPRWRYDIPLNFARVAGFSAQTVSNEMAIILTLFHAVRGSWDSFLFTDPYSNTATLTSFGTGTGALTTFQLLDLDGFPIYDLNGVAQIYVNGVLKTVTTDYTISATGLVTFAAAPANGVALTWSGACYRRVRFDMDEFEMTQIVNLCWGQGTLKLVSVKS